MNRFRINRALLPATPAEVQAAIDEYIAKITIEIARAWNIPEWMLLGKARPRG